MPRKREYDDRPAGERPTEEVGYKKPPKSSSRRDSQGIRRAGHAGQSNFCCNSLRSLTA